MTSTKKTPRALTIVGPGKVGRSMHQAATKAGLESELLGRDFIAGSKRFRADLGQLLMLAVPDSEIARVCQALVEADFADGPVGHLSGATGLEALDAAASNGHETFSMHPLQTFADGETELEGIPCAVTASDPATAKEIFALASTLGMRPFGLADADRAVYHAAASMASNFLISLEQDASDLLAAITIEDSRSLLTPLLEQTLRNWTANGAKALTGPIVRGDEETVSRHEEALRRQAPELLDVYRALAERTRAVASQARQNESESVAA